MLAEGNINFEFDSETQEYYITWEPVVIGLGKTRQEAMEDLRTAAQFYIDTIIDIKLEDTGIRKEN